MKRLFFLSTRPWIYLTEIPPAILLTLAIMYNDSTKGHLKLYPLQFALVLGMLFILVYFIKFITISNDEIRAIAPFLSRDKAIINKDKTLVIRVISKTRLCFELYGNEPAPAFDWLKSDKDYVSADINLFREKALGTRSGIKRILKFFELTESEAEAALLPNSETVTDKVKVTSLTNEGGEFEVRIKFLITI